MITDNIEAYAPLMMRRLRRWCFYRLEQRGTAKKKTKVPYCPHKPKRFAKTNDPQTWGTIEDALIACRDHGGDGISFMLQKADGLVFVDLDHCINQETGELSELAQFWVDRFDSYTEVSQSGTGLHIIARAKMASDGFKDDRLGVEVYSHARQICMNPNIYAGLEALRDAQGALDQFLDEFFKDRHEKPTAEKIEPVRVASVADADVQALVDKFCQSDARRALWEQRQECDLGPDQSQSITDFNIALNGLRLGFSHDDIGALIVRNRELYSDDVKKAHRRDYLTRTIENAMSAHAAEKEKAALMNSGNVVQIQFREKSGELTTVSTGTPPENKRDTQEDIPPDSLGSQFQFLTCDEAQTIDSRLDWLARDYVPLDSIVWFFGKPSAGKSFAVLSLAMSVAVGRPWGQIPVKQGGVLYVCGEGLSGLGKRLAGIRDEYNVRENPKNMLITNEPVLFNSEKHVLALVDRIKHAFGVNGVAPLRLLVIDTKSANMVGNESDAEAMMLLVRNLRIIQRVFGCTILVVDHVGKGDSVGMRGSSVQLGAAEVAYLFERLEDEKITPEPNLAFISQLCVHKPPKDFEAPESLDFKARVVDASRDGSQHRTTLVMLPTPPRVRASVLPTLDTLSDIQRQCYDALNELEAENKKDAPYNATQHKQVTYKEWRDACLDSGIARRSVFRNLSFLVDGNYVVCIPPNGDKSVTKSLWHVGCLIDD